MKYPNIILYRLDEYNQMDNFFQINENQITCSVNITGDEKELNKLLDCNYQLFVTYGEKSKEVIRNIFQSRIMYNKWIHYDKIENVDTFNTCILRDYVNYLTKNPENKRPIFSLFTTCYKSYDKIIRAYESIKKQTMTDWEWVILDDSPEDEHFLFLKKLFMNDTHIRLYKRSENNGSIGNVKNEAVLLCRGKYVLEMDHDDEILPDVLLDATKVFEEDEEVGFVYMDFSNVYEDYSNFNYGNFFALGYSGYYRQKYNGRWLFVAVTPNINNITLSHIVAVPNHPRIWRREALLKMGNYSEFLPVSDDYELLIRTAVETKTAKIHKLGYIQYMNYNNNNFSLIRNYEINKLIHPIYSIYSHFYKLDDVMKSKNGYEEPTQIQQIWKRNKYNFHYDYCNKLINLNYKKQYCIIGVETINKIYLELKKLYMDETNDFIVLDNKYSSNDDKICNLLDFFKFDRMKCYSMDDCSDEELINYFNWIYRSCDKFCIINRNDKEINE